MKVIPREVCSGFLCVFLSGGSVFSVFVMFPLCPENLLRGPFGFKFFHSLFCFAPASCSEPGRAVLKPQEKL